jgi:hypothetical protein
MNTASGFEIATLIVTFLTGTAVAVFAWLTYRLSRSITRRRYSPVLEVYPIGSPETGSFEQSGVKYQGIKWQISLVNSGEAPIWIDNIGITMQVTQRHSSEEEVWTGIGKLCDLLDEEGNILIDRAIGVNGNSHRKITVFVCRGDIMREEHRLFKPGDITMMQIELLQRGKSSRPTGWLIERSDRFELPQNYGKETIARLV